MFGIFFSTVEVCGMILTAHQTLWTMQFFLWVTAKNGTTKNTG